MERRFRVRLDELLDDAEVPPGLLRAACCRRLPTSCNRLSRRLHTPEQQTNAHHYVQGLLSDLDSKDVESIAYLHDRERQGLQKFIGQVEWDHRPLLTELARPVGAELGPSRRSAGVRSFGLSQERDRVGRGAAAVVRTAGESRQLPGGHLFGLCVGRRTRPWLPTTGTMYLPKEVGRPQTAAEGRGAGRCPVPHAARTGAGDAGRAAWPLAAARLGVGRR